MNETKELWQQLIFHIQELLPALPLSKDSRLNNPRLEHGRKIDAIAKQIIREWGQRNDRMDISPIRSLLTDGSVTRSILEAALDCAIEIRANARDDRPSVSSPEIAETIGTPDWIPIGEAMRRAGVREPKSITRTAKRRGYKIRGRGKSTKVEEEPFEKWLSSRAATAGPWAGQVNDYQCDAHPEHPIQHVPGPCRACNATTHFVAKPEKRGAFRGAPSRRKK